MRGKLKRQLVYNMCRSSEQSKIFGCLLSTVLLVWTTIPVEILTITKLFSWLLVNKLGTGLGTCVHNVCMLTTLGKFLLKIGLCIKEANFLWLRTASPR